MKLADENYDVYNIPVAHIWFSEDANNRDSITFESVEDLADSIEEHGLLFPVSITPAEDTPDTPPGFQFKLVSGYRRFAACRQVLKWDTIPASIQAGKEPRQLQILNLMENLARKNLNILEEAEGIDKNFPLYRTDASVAAELKQTRIWVKVRRALMGMADFIKDAAASGRLTETDIRRLVSCSRPEVLAKKMLRAVETGRSKASVQLNASPKKNKAEVRALITTLLKEGFNPNLLRMLGWTIGDVSDEDFAETLSWLRSKKVWLR